jgi:hypothetical protein
MRSCMRSVAQSGHTPGLNTSSRPLRLLGPPQAWLRPTLDSAAREAEATLCAGVRTTDSGAEPQHAVPHQGRKMKTFTTE